ncbi:hypothetical protein [Streptomyces sp. NPDC002845]
MRNHLRRPAAASLLLAAVLTVAGCSSSDDDTGANAPSAPSASASTSTLSAADRLAEEQDSGTDSSPAPSESTSSSAPVRPDSELKPATGSFTKKEKEYLSGRVPESVEPAAVLEVGHESCQRIERTAKRDKDAAVGAIVSGEIRDAADAITHLCPKQQPVLDAAEGGYPDGTHADPEPGRYRTVSAGPDCLWTVTDAKGRELASGPGPGGDDAPHALAIPSGAAEFVSSGCYAWVRA